MIEFLDSISRGVFGIISVISVLSLMLTIFFIIYSAISLVFLIIFLIIQTFGFPMYVKNRKTGKMEVYRFFRRIKSN